MSEEEKKAIKYFYNLRATIDESNMLFDEDINVKCGKETVKHITTVLNLIQKQQEEIERLENIKNICPITNTSGMKCELKEKGIIGIGIDIDIDNFYDDYIAKSKIKNKIEQIQKDYEETLKKVDFKEIEKMNKIIFRGITLEGQRSVLKELLESEENNE